MKLIKYRDEGMHTFTYFWVNDNDQMISPFYNSSAEAYEFVPDVTSIQDFKNEDDEFARIERENRL